MSVRIAAALVQVMAFCVLSTLTNAADKAPRSGIEYASAELWAMQADDFANPGMLWVARGEKLWNAPAGRDRRSCAGCHGAAEKSLRGAATRYPQTDRTSGRFLNLEGRINQCRSERQDAGVLSYESEELLALTAYVAHQSRGLPVAVVIEDSDRERLTRGREIYYRRQGQMNLACTHCHEQNAGKRLLAETISEGHGNAYPIYRLEWQTAGSLHRRLRACYFGIRAERPPFGSDDLLNLELFLADRARGLTVETPGVRR